MNTGSRGAEIRPQDNGLNISRRPYESPGVFVFDRLPQRWKSSASQDIAQKTSEGFTARPKFSSRRKIILIASPNEFVELEHPPLTRFWFPRVYTDVELARVPP